MSKKKPLIIITGPTAVGKTKLSIEVAKALNGEIISADSMQVYRGMDIGTAKIREEEKENIPHHLIDVLDPSDDFNVVMFCEYAKKAIEDILSKKHIPIIVGGTGFYIQALLYDIDFTENDSDMSYREYLQNLSDEKGSMVLYEMLKEVDPAATNYIHPNNVKKLIRALEFYKKTGSTISEHNEQQHQNESPYDFSYIVVNDTREKIYGKIDQRVDEMVENGLVLEVEKLLKTGIDRKCISLQGLGYKEIIEYFDGKVSLEEAVEQIKKGSRHFAKRQLTWFKREKETIWINKYDFDDEKSFNEHVIDLLKKKYS